MLSMLIIVEKRGHRGVDLPWRQTTPPRMQHRHEFARRGRECGLSMPDDRDRPPHLPPAKPNDDEGAGPELALTVNWLQPATPSPRATASFTASHFGSSRRRLGVIPTSAQAASTAARVAEPSYGEIHVAASASRRDIQRPASWGGPTTTISSSTSGSASISGAAANPPTTPSSARWERSASIVCAELPTRCSRARRDAHAGT